MSRRHCLAVLIAVAVVLTAASWNSAQTPRLSAPLALKGHIVLPPPYAPDEPIAEAFSLHHSARYLDLVATDWMRRESCGGCHTNFMYVLARPQLKDAPGSAMDPTRKFLEKRVDEFHKPGDFFTTSVVSTAAALAFDDARTTGKLHPATRRALDLMWARQSSSGWWEPEGCGKSVAPTEFNAHYTACLAAMAVHVAPEGYAKTPKARDGITKLLRYFAQNAPQDLHDKALLLWTSKYMDGLLTTVERDAIVKELLAKQHADGGWGLHTLAPQRRHHPRNATAPRSPTSDGYSTGFAIYVLRQANVSATNPQILRGIGWLQSNQRASGRWHTMSPGAGVHTETGRGTRDLYVLNAGTAFAVMALQSCDEGD
ncbi:MAG: hypothetical protein K2R98_14285 [Gemmataceae bacterium]|nr:hypothetical protein [Gemmataceae bacterium]